MSTQQTSPELKAKELVDKFMVHSKVGIDCNSYKEAATAKTEHAKQCALLCVDEIIKSDPSDPHDGQYYELNSDRIEQVIEYWNKVREAIINL